MNPLEQAYSQILTDPIWNSWMEKIDNPPENEKWEVLLFDHGRKHTMQVVKNVEDFLEQLHADEDTIWLAKIAALLHDIGNSEGREDHTEASFRLAEPYLNNFNLTPSQKHIILHAIHDHSKGADLQNLVDAAVILGDKLDVSRSRAKPDVEPNALYQELLKIHDTKFVIDDQVARLEYTTDPDFHLAPLKDWSKGITIPEKIAKFLGREFEFYVNGVKTPPIIP